MTTPIVQRRRDVNHRFWIDLGDEVFTATVCEDVLPGTHWVTCGDHSKDFTDLGEALVWAQTQLIAAVEAAREELP